MTTGKTLLTAEGLCKSFGGLQALADVSLTLNTGEILGIVGPNGAGKSVLINLITQFHAPSAGRLTLAGEDVTGHSRLRMARCGVARTFQNIRLFKRMTVLENVLVADPDTAARPLVSVFRRKAGVERALELLDLMRLGAQADRLIIKGSMSLSEIGRQLRDLYARQEGGPLPGKIQGLIEKLSP